MFLTGSCLWLVPKYVSDISAKDVTASLRTREGPLPNRPSWGSSSSGITKFLSIGT